MKNPAMPAEDFSFYLREKEGCFVWLGTAKDGETPWPLHNSRFVPDEKALESALCMHLAVLNEYLG